MADEIGVRPRLEQFLANPGCETNTKSALFNVGIDEVVAHLKNQGKISNWIEPIGSGISSIARAQGEQFEASLFANGCEELLAISKKLKIVEKQVNEIFRFVERNTDLKHAEDKIAASSQLIRNMCESKEVGLWAINGFVIPAHILEDDAFLEIDVVLASRKSTGLLEIHLGEAKTYPYKGGRTNSHQLETARAQLGLYHYLFGKFITAAELDENVRLHHEGFLVLQDIKTGAPFVEGREDLTYLSKRAEQASSLISDDKTNTHIRPDKALALVADSAHQFQESCWVQCGLAQYCHAELVAQDKSLVLGESASVILGNGSLTVQEALELIEVALDPEQLTDLSMDLVERFREATFPQIEDASWR